MKILFYKNRADPKYILSDSILLLPAASGITKLYCIGSVISLLRKIVGNSKCNKTIHH